MVLQVPNNKGVNPAAGKPIMRMGWAVGWRSHIQEISIYSQGEEVFLFTFNIVLQYVCIRLLVILILPEPCSKPGLICGLGTFNLYPLYLRWSLSRDPRQEQMNGAGHRGREGGDKKEGGRGGKRGGAGGREGE